MRDLTLLEQLQYHLNWRRIGNTTAVIAGAENTRETILIVRDKRHADSMMHDFNGTKENGEVVIGGLHLKTIFDIPNLKGYNMPVIIDHFALSDLITQHTAAINKYYRDKGDFDTKADELVEKKYQLRVEHNHRDMKWYAYYAGKDQRGLFDDDIDWHTGSDTPTEALDKLKQLLEGGKLS